MDVNAINRVSSATAPTSPTPSKNFKVDDKFLSTLQGALTEVSGNQAAATEAENAVAAGVPGASMATALVLSDKAEIGWNAVVAVRNEVVSAYQTLSNMQI